MDTLRRATAPAVAATSARPLVTAPAPMRERIPGRVVRDALAAASLFALAIALFPDDAFAEGVPIFDAPPSADELADILFPVQTRSIVIDDEVSGPGARVGRVAATNDAGAVPGGASPPAEPPPNAFGLLVNFDYGKATITDASRPYLDSVGQMLNLERAAGQAIVIEGHTDAVGGDAYNQWLSEQRALAVRRYLVGVHRVEESRLRTVGKGESELHEPTDPAAAINRRVQFRLLDAEGEGA